MSWRQISRVDQGLPQRYMGGRLLRSTAAPAEMGFDVGLVWRHERYDILPKPAFSARVPHGLVIVIPGDAVKRALPKGGIERDQWPEGQGRFHGANALYTDLERCDPNTGPFRMHMYSQ